MPINLDLDTSVSSLCYNCKTWWKKIESCNKLTLCFPHKILKCRDYVPTNEKYTIEKL